MKQNEVIWVSESKGMTRRNKITLIDNRVSVLRQMDKASGDIYERLRNVGTISLWTYLRLDVAREEIRSENPGEMIKYALGLCLMEP